MAPPTNEEEEAIVTPEEIIAAMKRKGKSGTAPGLDGIRMKALRAIPKEEIPILARCYTRCLKEGRFPEFWKRAALVLIPKEWPIDANEPKVRPICLLSETGKILEAVLASRIWNWMEDNPPSRLSDDQFGFCPGKSTCDALSQVCTTIQRVGEQGGGVCRGKPRHKKRVQLPPLARY